jgi:hypothetical protein
VHLGLREPREILRKAYQQSLELSRFFRRKRPIFIELIKFNFYKTKFNLYKTKFNFYRNQE